MSNVTTHSTKANAVKAALAYGLTEADAELVVEHVGMTFQFNESKAERILVARKSEHLRTVENPHPKATEISDSPEQAVIDLDNVQACGYSHCPHCGIHLSNGVCDFDSMVDTHGSEREALKIMSHEWTCLGCNGEWGPQVKGSKGRGAPTRHYTNKSDAELKAQGGAVKVCWDLFLEQPDLKRKDAIAAAVAKGVAFYTARTQYQKFFQAQKNSKRGRGK